MGSEKNIYELIVRLFEGKTSNEEKKQIESWLEKGQENKTLFNDFEEVWFNAEKESNNEEFNVEQAIQNFRRRIKKEKKYKIHKLNNILRYAAVFILILALPFTWWWFQKKYTVSENFTTIECAYGDRSTIYLPDGSKVCLNSGSKITFDNTFKSGVRKLSLEGEAFFSVKKDSEIPFIVNTDDLQVEVLGTEFNLKAYPDEESVSVTLVTGSLQVSNSQQTAMVFPRQKLLYEKENHSITFEDLSDLAPDTEWTNGRLVFRNESLEELEWKLERWFDVEIEFADETVRTRRFSGTLERESILEAISYFGSSKYVEYQIAGNVITFQSEKD